MELVFPEHKCALHLTHNEHRSYYETVEQCFGERDGWLSEEQKRKAYESGEVWELQWYPDTPVGFYVLLACDLDALMEHIRRLQTIRESPSPPSLP